MISPPTRLCTITKLGLNLSSDTFQSFKGRSCFIIAVVQRFCNEICMRVEVITIDTYWRACLLMYLNPFWWYYVIDTGTLGCITLIKISYRWIIIAYAYNLLQCKSVPGSPINDCTVKLFFIWCNISFDHWLLSTISKSKLRICMLVGNITKRIMQIRSRFCYLSKPAAMQVEGIIDCYS